MGRHGVDDWADQDLLTKDVARERLAAEIDRTKDRLAALRHADDDAEIMLLTRRLAAMESICGELAQGITAPTRRSVATR